MAGERYLLSRLAENEEMKHRRRMKNNREAAAQAAASAAFEAAKAISENLDFEETAVGGEENGSNGVFRK